MNFALSYFVGSYMAIILPTLSLMTILNAELTGFESIGFSRISLLMFI